LLGSHSLSFIGHSSPTQGVPGTHPLARPSRD
jgi:hypothetical protein